MKLTIAHLLDLIDELPKGNEFEYVKPGKNKAKLISVDRTNNRVELSRVVTATKAETSSFLNEDNLQTIVDSVTENNPFSIDKIFNNGGNTRSVWESIIANTSEFYKCMLGKNKNLVWIPTRKKQTGVILEIPIADIPNAVNDAGLSSASIREDFSFFLSKCVKSSRNTNNIWGTLGDTAVQSYLSMLDKRDDGRIELFDYNPFKWSHIQDIYQIINTKEVEKIFSELLNDPAFTQRDKEHNQGWRSGALNLYILFLRARNYFSKNTTYNRIAISNVINDKSYRPYLTALRTKPFLLLAGISGTGKSRIVKEMAFASCPDVAELRKDPVSPGNYLLVEVKPNWHDSTELLGYESTIKKGYVLTPFVKFLYKAMKHPDVPFFVCLDEMNLAPVEQYFAEYLSILESRKQQADGTILTEPLISAEVFKKYPELCAEMNGTAVRRENVKNTYMTTDPAVEYVATEREYENLCEEGLRIPQNVVVIGTVNMDETTHQFSRKVIDRAMTIEMNEVKFDGFFESSSELSYPDSVLPKEYFLPCHTAAGKALESVPDDAEYIKANVPAMLEQLNEALADTPFKIAYRVQNELVLYFAALRQEEAHKATGTAELLATAMDQILMMKVLPRIEGDDELLEEPLERLAVYAEGHPMASAKIKEMQERLGRSHFTSFWP